MCDSGHVSPALPLVGGGWGGARGRLPGERDPGADSQPALPRGSQLAVHGGGSRGGLTLKEQLVRFSPGTPGV